MAALGLAGIAKDYRGKDLGFKILDGWHGETEREKSREGLLRISGNRRGFRVQGPWCRWLKICDH